MPEIEDGEAVEIQGSAAKPYLLKNVGGVYSCTCPAWLHQSTPVERRSCKHLRAYRGEDEELARTGGEAATRPKRKAASDEGEAATADKPPLLLAHSFEPETDPTGWWMSEKLDGVRAYWTGREFRSRLGNPYLAPTWFTAGLPAHPLDGELWTGRKRFQRTVSIVRRQDRSEDWREVRFVVFDAPALERPFEARLEAIAAAIPPGHPHAAPHPHERCRDLEHLRAELSRVEALGGEGLMLRRPGSRYEVGRSSTLLKVKTFKDAEAKVVAHAAGTGKHAGRLGALVVELPDGKQFSVGTGFSDRERETPPPIGSTITFRYQELSEAGIPRFPSFVRVREDDVEVAKLPVEKPKPRPAAAAPASVAAPSPSGALRRFELSEGSANKFWEIEVLGATHRVRFGRIGTAGQAKEKSFPSEAACAADADKLVAEKTKKGYVEV